MERKTLSFSVSESQGRKLERLAKEMGVPRATYAKMQIAKAVADCEKSESYLICRELMGLRSRIIESFSIIRQFCESSSVDGDAYERAKEAAGIFVCCASRIADLADTLYGWCEPYIR